MIWRKEISIADTRKPLLTLHPRFLGRAETCDVALYHIPFPSLLVRLTADADAEEAEDISSGVRFSGSVTDGCSAHRPFSRIKEKVSLHKPPKCPCDWLPALTSERHSFHTHPPAPGAAAVPSGGQSLPSGDALFSSEIPLSAGL